MSAVVKIKVLFVIDCLNGVAGTEKHLYELMRNLDREAYAFDVIAFSGTDSYVDTLRKQGFTVKVLDIRRPYGYRSLRKYLDLIRQIRKVDYDVVQTFHFFSDTVGVVLAALAGARNIVSSRRDMGFRKTRLDILVNRVFNRLITRFIAVSGAVRERIVEVEGIDGNRIVTIYNGVDTRRLDQVHADGLRGSLGIGERDVVVGIVGHLRPEKNHQLLFRAVRLVKDRDRNFKCLVVGGWAVDAYRRICEEMGIADHVVFTGHVDEPLKYISVFDIGCLTSTTEGMSNALIEKMAMGKPVIATRVGGNVELVRDRYNGFLVSPDDPAELADAILYLIGRGETREEMGRRSREIIAADFSIGRMVGQHEALYRSLVAEKGSPRPVRDPR